MMYPFMTLNDETEIVHSDVDVPLQYAHVSVPTVSLHLPKNISSRLLP